MPLPRLFQAKHILHSQKGDQMADAVDKTQSKPTPARAGALKSTLSVQLHTQYAILLWGGRQQEKETDKPQIVSMPQVIARAG